MKERSIPYSGGILLKYITGALDIIIITAGIIVAAIEARYCLGAVMLRSRVRDAVDDLDMKKMQRCSAKLNEYISWHSFIGVVITVFPLMGMFGTVLGLLDSVDSGAGEVGSFLTALSTTLWGIVASIVTKAVEAAWIKILMDSETVLSPYAETVFAETTAERYYKKALRYEKGEGVPADEEEAYSCYRQAAEMGNADAQYKMGEFSEKGICCSKSLKEAEYWYHKSFENGNDKAGVALKRLYSGVTDDEK